MLEQKGLSKMNLNQIIDKWNETANEFNCWDKLDEAEKVEFAFKCGVESEKHRRNAKTAMIKKERE